MMELVYPYDIAPLVPAPTAEVPTLRLDGDEVFPVVQPNGMVVGRSTRTYCHSGAKPLHPVVHIHIIDRFSRIYLQKSSMKKDIQPGKWDTAVGGHVSYGESVVEAVYREAFEELRLMEFNPIYIETYQRDQSPDIHEIIQDFLEFLKAEGLMDVFAERWVV